MDLSTNISMTLTLSEDDIISLHSLAISAENYHYGEMEKHYSDNSYNFHKKKKEEAIKLSTMLAPQAREILKKQGYKGILPYVASEAKPIVTLIVG